MIEDSEMAANAKQAAAQYVIKVYVYPFLQQLALKNARLCFTGIGYAGWKTSQLPVKSCARIFLPIIFATE